MTTVLSCRCRKCQKVSNLLDMRDNPTDIGLVCADPSKCKENVLRRDRYNKAFQTDKIVVSHLLQKGAKAAPQQFRR